MPKRGHSNTGVVDSCGHIYPVIFLCYRCEVEPLTWADTPICLTEFPGNWMTLSVYMTNGQQRERERERERELKVKVKDKVSLCLTKHHATKTYWVVEVYLHAFLTSALDDLNTMNTGRAQRWPMLSRECWLYSSLLPLLRLLTTIITTTDYYHSHHY
jgi:hypothetical protein